MYRVCHKYLIGVPPLGSSPIRMPSKDPQHPGRYERKSRLLMFIGGYTVVLLQTKLYSQ